MIDKPEKTSQLLARLMAALPFEVDLTSELLATLKKSPSCDALERRQTVSNLSYMGDEGGIMTLRVNSLQLENEFAAYRNGVGHIIVATLCLLSFYTLTLSFLPNFKSLAHGLAKLVLAAPEDFLQVGLLPAARRPLTPRAAGTAFPGAAAILIPRHFDSPS